METQRETTVYLSEIQDTGEQVERLRLQCQKLQQQNRQVGAQLCRSQSDRTDIPQYFLSLLSKKEQEVEEMTRRVQLLQEEVQQEVQAQRAQHRQEEEQLQKALEELRERRRRQAAECEEQQEQLRQEDLLLDSLKEELSELKEKTLFELKEKIRRQQEQKKSEENNLLIKKEKVSIMQQEELQEKKEHFQQLRLLCHQAEKLLRIRENLLVKENLVCSRWDMEEEELVKVTKMIPIHKKEIERLLKKHQELKEKINDQRVAHKRLLTEEEEKEEEEEEPRKLLAIALQESSQKAAVVVELKQELQEEQSRRRHLQGVTEEVSCVLRRITTQPEKTTAARTRLQTLLDVLETTPTSNRPQTLDPLFLLWRYRLGDLGFVPPPRDYQATWSTFSLQSQHRPQDSSCDDPDVGVSTSADP